MKRNYLALALALIMALGMLCGCGEKEEEAPLDPVTLTIAGGWPDCRAIESVGRAFTEKYPNCTVVYEYLQDYYESAAKRMTGEDAVDLFFTTNIQADSAMLPYALDLNSCEGLDLSQTFDGLIENFTFREEGGDTAKLYALPLGAEMRGLYINTTLLKSLDIETPTDQTSLLSACETLKENGYIPFHGNPGDFAQTLLYPWICNLIANAEDPQAVYAQIDGKEAGISELFREPFSFLYTLVENGYYDYKWAQTELNLFNETGDQSYARYFLDIRQNGDTWEKADGPGQIAFMPSPMSMQNVVEKTKEDYHSEIEYVFVPAPVGPEGGFAYLSPAHGIAANKDSANVEWSVRFLDFLFQPENNELFAEEFNVIPNTKEALQYITELYDIPSERISQLGQVTFHYDFYTEITDCLVETSKGNNPKYMQTDASGATSLYPLEYYMGHLEDTLTGNEQ